MTERRDYSEMSPRELNSELRQLYEQLPIKIRRESDFDSAEWRPEETHRHLDERKRSEHKKIIMDSLEKLSPYFNGSPFFNEWIAKKFSFSYQVGVDKENVSGEAELFEVMLDLGLPGSGGVFDSKRVKFIEYRLYERELMDSFKTRIGDRSKTEEALNVETMEVVDPIGYHGDFRDEELNIFDLDFPLGEYFQEWLASYMQHYPNSDDLLH